MANCLKKYQKSHFEPIIGTPPSKFSVKSFSQKIWPHYFLVTIFLLPPPPPLTIYKKSEKLFDIFLENYNRQTGGDSQMNKNEETVHPVRKGLAKTE